MLFVWKSIVSIKLKQQIIMKNYCILLLIFISCSVQAQHSLQVRNRSTNETHRFNTNYEVYMKLLNDTAMYSGWRIEQIKDSSMVISSPRNYCDGPEFQKAIEIYYSDISFIRFEHVNVEETFFTSAGMAFGGFLILLGPSMSTNEKTNELNTTSMCTTMACGAVLATSSYIIHRKLVKRKATFGIENWSVESAKTVRKA